MIRVSVVNAVPVPGKEIPQGCEIIPVDVAVPVNGEVADLVAVGRQAQVAGSRAQFLCDGLGQRLAVGRVGNNGHGAYLLQIWYDITHSEGPESQAESAFKCARA